MMKLIRTVFGVIGLLTASAIAADLAQGSAVAVSGPAAPVSATKGARQDGRDCGSWPEIARHCPMPDLTAVSGAPSRHPVRTITVERRSGASSELIRVPVR